MQKVAIVVLSDPATQTEESLGRTFNALAAAYDFKQRGDDVTVLFQGAGTRWAGQLSKPEHPFHDLFNAVSDRVAGVSCGCADVFGASDDATTSGFELVKDNPVPGTSGLPSLGKLMAEGFTVLTF
jgi:hypothetical protein